MVFSPKQGIVAVQSATVYEGKSSSIVTSSISNMIKTAQVLEQRQHQTRSPQVLLNDKIMLKNIYSKLNRLGYNI